MRGADAYGGVAGPPRTQKRDWTDPPALQSRPLVLPRSPVVLPPCPPVPRTPRRPPWVVLPVSKSPGLPP
ncbi:hypothetical protein GCM10010377_37540 [Streptomyces viridiviolaceus]|nr:hypothetical protein GCM10010377_37540 [Streptomyces viridiviolaceus]